MAIAMLIAGPDAAEPMVGPDAAERLAELGISRIAVLSDPLGIAVVLEGWAFDPTRIEEAALAIFRDGMAGIRFLREVELVTLTGSSVAAAESQRALRRREGVDVGRM